MNERIKELREQAWTLVSNEERDRGEVYEAREQWERCDQKFAELIVAEMLQTCEDHPGWSGRMIGEQIKQDFGVEE